MRNACVNRSLFRATTKPILLFHLASSATGKDQGSVANYFQKDRQKLAACHEDAEEDEEEDEGEAGGEEEAEEGEEGRQVPPPREQQEVRSPEDAAGEGDPVDPKLLRWI